ncbi:MAG: PilZ domain-containing protein [Candidatus Omnitrophica bacterium]|nr:PilZ domain-containing protein [Candidatus Omnitrophota bacterium]
MESRLASRIQITISVISKIDEKLGQKVHLAQGDRFKAATYNVSTIGVGLHVKKYFLPIGLIIDLEIDGAPFGLKEMMKIRGEVRHCEFLKSQIYECGIKFLNLPAEYKQAIAKFLADRKK